MIIAQNLETTVVKIVSPHLFSLSQNVRYPPCDAKDATLTRTMYETGHRAKQRYRHDGIGLSTLQEHVPPARAFHTSAREELSRAGADAGDTRDALGEERRKMQCEAQLHARCTDGSRLRQVKTGLLGKLYQVGSCYPRRDFARELLLNTSLLPRSHPLGRPSQNPP